jgi:glycosyltransferase involved in cell wall biosynthesis
VTTLAFHVDQLLYPNPGGTGTYIRNLVPALAEADPDLEIALFHARFDRNRPPERWTRGFWTEELSHGIRALYPSWAASGRPLLPASLSGRDLLHAPSPSAIPPKGPRQRMVVTVHDVAFLTHPEMFPPRWRLLFRAGLRRAVRTADAIVTVSEHTAAEVRRVTSIDPERVHPAPLAPALPVTETDPDAVAGRYRIPRPYLLFNGLLEPRKNLLRLVHAYRRASAAGAPHALVLAGGLGWKPDELLAELKVQAPGKVVLTGHVPDAVLDALFRGASAFVYPSLAEGFGLPVLDAMVRGIPCVVASATSLPEVAGDAALLADPLSIPGLAEALSRVLMDEALAGRLAEAGRRRAAAFSWRRTAEATLEVYRSILQS